MTADQATDKSGTAPDALVEESLAEQLGMMWRAFMESPVRNTLLWVGGGILVVILATAFGQIILNRWNQPFYDAMERRDLQAFLHQLQIFVFIAGGILLLNVAQTWLNQMLRLKLREGLVRDLVNEWMRPRRAFRLANAGAIGVNPDQRLHEDARHLTELSTDLGIGLLQASILLVSFVGVLWSLSSGFVFHVWGKEFAIPGYMVWAAFLYAGVASTLSWFVGRPLIRLNSERYAREAEFRFSLMRVNEHIDAISLAAGEQDERRRLELDLATVLQATRRIVGAMVRLNWVTAGYGWITVVAPFIIAAPIYSSGDLTFGGLMMAVGAFNQVHASLRWFVDNIGGITDWRATLLRVAAFRAAMLKVDELHDVEKRISFVAADGDQMTFENVEVASPAGCTEMVDKDVVIHAGERVLVTGGRGAGKTLFFRAIAGLWPWGGGRIGLPAGGVTFVPRSPYFPPGSLRDALSYPVSSEAYTDADLAAVLEKVGLDRFAGALDRVARWDRELSEEDQRLLAFAQLGLHKPGWVVIDEALDEIKGDARRRVIAMLDKDLADASIISIGQADRDHFFTRELKLAIDPDRRKLKAVQIDPVKRNGRHKMKAKAA